MENDIVRFILARLDDDEREIKKLQKATGSNGGNGSNGTNGTNGTNGKPNGNPNGSSDGSFPSLARLTADSAAKREIVGVLQRLLVLRDLPAERPVRDGATEVLRRMALPYEGHAGYRTEWRPKRSGV